MGGEEGEVERMMFFTGSARAPKSQKRIADLRFEKEDPVLYPALVITIQDATP